MRFRLATCAGWLFVSLVLLAPAAHADLVKQAGDTVKRALAPVAPQPAPTPAPAAPPSIPRTPTPSPPAPELPSAPSTSPVTEPVQRVTDGVSSTVRSAAQSPAPQTGGSRGESGTGGSGSRSAPGGGSAGAGSAGGEPAHVPLAGRGGSPGYAAGGTGGGVEGSSIERRQTRTDAGLGTIFGARPALDPRFSAYVWPAVALGRAAGAVLAAIDLPLAVGLGPIAPELPRILAAAALASTASLGEPAPPAAERSRRQGPPPPLPYAPDHLPNSGELSFILLLLLCLAPLTVFAYSIVRELRQMPRWPIN